MTALLKVLAYAGICERQPDDSAYAACWQQMALADSSGVSCLLRLLHMHLAWALQEEHSRLRGRSTIPAPAAAGNNSSSSRAGSSSRRQGLQVPRYHEQCLNDFGTPANNIESHRAAMPTPLDAAAIPAIKLHMEAMQAHCRISGHATTTTSSSGSSSSSSTSQIAAPLPRQQQQQRHILSAAQWQQLGEAAVVPMPEQLRLVVEAALLGPPAILILAIDLFAAPAAALQHHGCLNAAGSVMLPSVLHLLSLAVPHALQHPQLREVEEDGPSVLRLDFAALVAVLLQAAGVIGYKCGLFVLPIRTLAAMPRV
jgi:hypothetical protein